MRLSCGMSTVLSPARSAASTLPGTPPTGLTSPRTETSPVTATWPSTGRPVSALAATTAMATPAEGLSGRFVRMDRARYGSIPGVTDRDYYVNSFHVDVREPVSIVEKIRLEAPFHAITRGGHITYVELDGEARKNPVAILKIVKVMQDEGIGYGSINHPIDTCRKCGHRGVIYSKCPVCGSDDILRMRRITGYLTGDLSSWNSAKRAEERDRVKHL